MLGGRTRVEIEIKTEGKREKYMYVDLKDELVRSFIHELNAAVFSIYVTFHEKNRAEASTSEPPKRKGRKSKDL